MLVNGRPPVFIRTSEVAKILGYRVERARRWLRRNGALIVVDRDEAGRPQYGTTVERLRQHVHPDIWEEVSLRATELGVDMDE